MTLVNHRGGSEGGDDDAEHQDPTDPLSELGARHDQGGDGQSVHHDCGGHRGRGNAEVLDDPAHRHRERRDVERHQHLS
jgi:hypothetical protein